jgi:hypothetical protein
VAKAAEQQIDMLRHLGRSLSLALGGSRSLAGSLRSPLASFGSAAHHDDEHDEEHGPATTPTVFDKVRFNIMMSMSPQKLHRNNIFSSFKLMLTSPHIIRLLS